MPEEILPTRKQRLLMLDAALTLCEGVFAESNPNVHAGVAMLQDELDILIAEAYPHSMFKNLLREQKEACQAMAESPILFSELP